MKLAMVGTGYVGLVSGACLAEIGHEVVCVDIDAAKAARINRGEATIVEKGLDELVARNVKARRLSATTELSEAMKGAVLTMIAVGTPFDGRHIDLGYVREVSRQIGTVLRHLPDYHVVCVKSTVVPGTTEQVVGPLVEAASGRRAGQGFGLAMNPEFLAEGTAVRDFMSPDRIVVGAIDERSAGVVRGLYAPFDGTDVVVTTPATAEMTKYAANSFLATVISYTNEIANLCAAVGDVDIVDVMAGVHLDRRLSPLLGEGRIRPGLLSFLHPGTGFGGSCFPKDVKALISYGEQHGQSMPILRSVIETNRLQPDVTLSLLRDELGELRGRRIAVLGLAFKPGTDDIRESPAIPLLRSLERDGARVIAHDPEAVEVMRAAYPELAVEYSTDLAAALGGADAVLLVTAWPEYGAVGRLLAGRAVPVIDGRRFLDPSSVARYRGIGRRVTAATPGA